MLRNYQVSSGRIYLSGIPSSQMKTEVPQPLISTPCEEHMYMVTLYDMNYDHLTDKEKNIIDGHTPVTCEQAERLIKKIENYQRWLGYCALDDIVAELADGMYVIPSDGKGVNYNLKAVMKKREELGRPLTDEEFEKFIIHNDE